MPRDPRGAGVAARGRHLASGLLAAAAVSFALLVPSDLSQIRPGSFLSLPLEGVAGAALLWVLPGAPRRVTAALFGVLLGAVTLDKVMDTGFMLALGRPFDLVLDWGLVASGVDFVHSAFGTGGAAAAVVAAILLAALIPFGLAAAVVRLSRAFDRSTPRTGQVVLVVAAIWMGVAAVPVRAAPGVPLASAGTARLLADRIERVRTGYRDEQAFLAEANVDAYARTPSDQLLRDLRGKDVLLIFVESYGRSAVQDPALAASIVSLLDAGTERLAADGFSARSGWLTSPTSGGGSWFAESTLLSGLWIDNQQRYRALLAGKRLTLTKAFDEAGWRTVAVMPGTTLGFTDDAFYGYDKVYVSQDLGYQGPSFSWSPMPDQYALSSLERLERTPGHPPLMIMLATTSSHAPWTPVPKTIPWTAVGDGSIFESMKGEPLKPEAILTRDPDQVRADYVRSIQYSLDTLLSYLQTYGSEDDVLIFLGDHQPAPVVVGSGADHDVPVTIVVKDPAVLDRIADWGWTDGLRPDDSAPTWRMDAFRDKFLTAFGAAR